jgi:hypothetical protein
MVERTHESSHHQSQPWIFTTLGQLTLVGAPEPPAMMSHASWSVLAYMECAPNRQPIPLYSIRIHRMVECVGSCRFYSYME